MIRSALYVPGDHDRAMAKSLTLDADMLIYDLEDGVAPEKKAYAREQIVANFNESSTKRRIVRVNHCSTSFYQDDLSAFAHTNLDGVMLSKVATTAEIDDAVSFFAKHSRGDIAIWCNVETPPGVANVFALAAHPNVRGLVAGTNDLANELRIRRTADRSGLLHSLQRIQLAARAHNRIVLDGTFVDFDDMTGLKAEAEQGCTLGFDGKTLVHPKQIEIANIAFSPTNEDIAEARAIIEAYEKAIAENKAVVLMNGKMIERLHYDRAKEILSVSVNGCPISILCHFASFPENC